MTNTQQRAALQRQIWQIANDVWGAVDVWDFKQYALGTLFYRFISENVVEDFGADDDSINYAELKTTVPGIDQLRSEIDAIVAQIEGEESKGEELEA